MLLLFLNSFNQKTYQTVVVNRLCSIIRYKFWKNFLNFLCNNTKRRSLSFLPIKINTTNLNNFCKWVLNRVNISLQIFVRCRVKVSCSCNTRDIYSTSNCNSISRGFKFYIITSSTIMKFYTSRCSRF